MGTQIPPERFVTAAVKLAELVAFDCNSEFREALNMKLGHQSELGGSAPVQFTFSFDPNSGRVNVASWDRPFVSVDLRALSPSGFVENENRPKVARSAPCPKPG